MTPQDSADSLTGASPEEQQFSLQLSKARLLFGKVLDLIHQEKQYGN